MRKADVTRAEAVEAVRQVESTVMPDPSLVSIALVKAILYVGDQLAYANDTLDAIQAAVETR